MMWVKVKNICERKEMIHKYEAFRSVHLYDNRNVMFLLPSILYQSKGSYNTDIMLRILAKQSVNN